MKAPLELSDIPFEETRYEEPPAPPFADLFASDASKRKAAKTHWVTHVVDGIGNHLFHYTVKAIPRDWASKLGAFVGGRAHRMYQNRIFARRTADNLERLSALAGVEFEAAKARWWENTGRALAEFSIVNGLWREGRIALEGKEHLEGLEGPPIFVSVHLATWIAGIVAIDEGIAGPSIGPFQPEPNRFTNRIVYGVRKARGQYLFPPGQKSAFRLRRLLASGAAKSLTIFIDEVRDAQIHFPLLGRGVPKRGNAHVAVKLANSCGGAIVPFYIVRTKDARFRMVICPAIPKAGEYEAEAAIRAMNDALEPAVIRHFDEWYMAQELRWPK